MFQTFINAWKVPDLKKKMLYTLFIIVIFRIGCAIFVPFVNQVTLVENMKGMAAEGTLLSYFSILTGGAFEKGTLFALSVTPYINASIIIQLLTVAIPALEKLSKEGEEGRKKLNNITRAVTIVLSVIMGFGYFMTIRNANAVPFTGGSLVFAGFVIVAALTAGSTIVMWLGELVNEKGVGNGISILLFAGIVSSGPKLFGKLYLTFKLGGANYFYVPFIVVMFVVVVAAVVLITDAERRIPVQYAKRVVGRKMYGGQNTHIPIKINMSGVMPIIFASAILQVPGTIGMFLQNKLKDHPHWDHFLNFANYHGWLYGILLAVLIVAFSYFYVTIQYNPVEMSNNLRRNSGTIPGIRPGEPTTKFIQNILSKVTLMGAIFLGVIALLPIIVSAITKVSGLAIGGTTLLILVGVALETVRQIESQIMLRHYKGFLD